MTDRELMQMALDVIQSEFATGGKNLYDPDTVIEALRDRLAQPEPEPVAYIKSEGIFVKQIIWEKPVKDLPDFTELYTAPPKREWVGLTDDEIWDCYTDQGKKFYLAIEAKLKEKNT